MSDDAGDRSEAQTHRRGVTWIRRVLARADLRMAAALLLPFAALGLQWQLWPWIQPYVWFLFFPAVFFSARLAGYWAGLASTATSAGIVWFVFIPPSFSWTVATPSSLYSVALFLLMGFLFSESEAQLRRVSRRVVEALAEARQAQARATELYHETKQLDEMKTRFFASVSHELRTPLTLILGPLRRRLDAPDLEAPERRDLEVMERNALVLYRQVSNLLDAARLEAGRMEVRLESVDLAAVVRAQVANFESLAVERAIRLTVETPAAMAGATDIEKLQRVLLNLLSNAFKFTPSGGSIAVRLRENRRESVREALLEVEDSGPGIAPENRQAVFEPFRQLAPALGSGPGGTGLGLAIVREMVLLLGGGVEVGDAASGGAHFTVRLPCAVPTAEAAATTDRVDPTLQRQALEELRPAASRPAAAPAVARAGDRPLVLVVEDNPDLREFIAAALAPRYRVAEAADGAAGLAQALALQPELVLTDLMMPASSGEEMIAALLASEATRRIPIVVLSAREDEHLRIALLHSGVQDYIAKPFAVEELVARVDAIVTARREAAARLRESEARFQASFDQAAIGMALVAVDGRWLRVNRRFCEILGFDEAELLERSFMDLTHAEDRAADREEIQELLAGVRTTATRQKRYLDRSGEVVWVNRTTSLVRRGDGSPDYFFAVVEDIRERRRIEQELATSAAALRDAQRLAELGNWRWDLRTGVHIWSEEIFHIYGRDPSLPPAVYPEVMSYFTAESWERLAGEVETALASGRAYECEAEVVRPDGTRRWIVARGESVRDPAGGVVELHGTVQDITGRRQAEEALRRSEAELRTLFVEMAQGVVYQGADGRITAANPAAMRILGLSLDELQGRASIDSRWRAIREDGSDFPGEEHPAMQALAGGERVSGVVMGVHNPRLGELRWLRVSAVPEIPPGAAAPTRVFSTFDDITDVKRAEEEIRRLNADLERRVDERTAELSAANREMDAFAYAVSHDLRAPLRALGGFSQMLLEEYAGRFEGEALSWLQRIDAASRRMADLIDGLLVLSRSVRGELERENVDLSALAAEAKEELERLEPGRRVAWAIDRGLTAVGDPRLLAIVLRNLLGNAWKYSSGVAAPEIRFTSTRQDGRTWFAVADNGAGFDMAHAARLFEPFQRLHRQDEFPGLGIGLATVERIVRRHGGEIRASAAPGKGATFSFTLGGRVVRSCGPSPDGAGRSVAGGR